MHLEQTSTIISNVTALYGHGQCVSVSKDHLEIPRMYGCCSVHSYAVVCDSSVKDACFFVCLLFVVVVVVVVVCLFLFVCCFFVLLFFFFFL